MPLLDHFHPPLSAERRWESFHSSWATRIADALTEQWLPPGYIAEEHAHLGPSVEIDIATFAQASGATAAPSNGAVALLELEVWAPPVADGQLPTVFPGTFEVRILSTDTGPKLVATIELISPDNKDRPTERRAFSIQCASYLHQGISVIIVDIVTNRRANLHNEILDLLQVGDPLRLPPETGQYAVAYRPVIRDSNDAIDVWRAPLLIGQPLPTLPLGLRGDLVIPVDLEATYVEACIRKRLTRT